MSQAASCLRGLIDDGRWGERRGGRGWGGGGDVPYYLRCGGLHRLGEGGGGGRGGGGGGGVEEVCVCE